MSTQKAAVLITLVHILSQNKSTISAVPPLIENFEKNVSASSEDINSLKYATKMLSFYVERWNNIFLTSLGPRMANTAALVSSIDSNIKNLQERAHVWDTFQLHVSAWNDQISTLDRKIDIISKGQEKMIALDSKINTIFEIEYKIDNVVKKVDDLENKMSILQSTKSDSLISEFATRGILSTIKMVEKKMDRLILLHQNHKLSASCSTPKILENLLKDVCAKTDIIFDRIAGREPTELNTGSEDDYAQELDEGSGEDIMHKKIVQREVAWSPESKDIEPKVELILSKQNLIIAKLSNLSQNILKKVYNKSCDLSNKILDSYFREQRAHIESLIAREVVGLKSYHSLNTTTCKTNIEAKSVTQNANEPQSGLKGCEDLSFENDTSGIFSFTSDSENRKFRFCEIRSDGLWTVIQRRDNFSSTENFSKDWLDYKNGFGNLTADFWLGNDMISQLSLAKAQILRIELEDFDNNTAWAEYSTFKVLSEEIKYKLIIGGYSGNASDSFSSHNNSLFSTFDQKNDQAPLCCPCAVSYGGGWWFNSCFEANLNGLYYREPNKNGYFTGIIWEKWLGNYSLKSTRMMIKSKAKIVSTETVEVTTEGATSTSREVATSFPDYEDP